MLSRSYHEIRILSEQKKEVVVTSSVIVIISYMNEYRNEILPLLSCFGSLTIFILVFTYLIVSWCFKRFAQQNLVPSENDVSVFCKGELQQKIVPIVISYVLVGTICPRRYIFKFSRRAYGKRHRHAGNWYFWQKQYIYKLFCTPSYCNGPATIANLFQRADSILGLSRIQLLRHFLSDFAISLFTTENSEKCQLLQTKMVHTAHYSIYVGSQVTSMIDCCHHHRPPLVIEFHTDTLQAKVIVDTICSENPAPERWQRQQFYMSQCDGLLLLQADKDTFQLGCQIVWNKDSNDAILTYISQQFHLNILFGTELYFFDYDADPIFRRQCKALFKDVNYWHLCQCKGVIDDALLKELTG